MPCRAGDVGGGRCPSHDSSKNYNTVFVPGQATVIVEGAPVIRIGDVGMATCGHPTVCLTGAVTAFAVGSPPHRMGDSGANSGAYVALSGAATVWVEQ